MTDYDPNKPTTVKVESWLVMKGTPATYGGAYRNGPYKGQKPIDRVRIVKTTAGKPTLTEDEIAFRLELVIESDIFLDPTGTIRVHIPNASAQPNATAITAQVDAPIRGRGQSAAAAAIQHP